jgi:hypothetical protein
VVVVVWCGVGDRVGGRGEGADSAAIATEDAWKSVGRERT